MDRKTHPGAGRRLGIAVAMAAAAGLLLVGGCAVHSIKVSADLAKASEALQATPARPAHRLLIVGDSTAVGTGASSPQASVAGLIARDHPDWLIENRARNGDKLADVLRQLETRDRYDTVLVMAGGNDVIRLTPADELRLQVGQALKQARAVAPRVVLMPPGNVGNAPFFFAPLSWWMSSRSRELQAIAADAAAAEGAIHVKLYKKREDDPFAQQPDRMNAVDGLHPSDDGYALWREALREQAGF